jgi:hypothetical protein
LIPATGILLGQNEEFCLLITVKNASPDSGGLALKNVRYHLWVENPEILKLIVPNAPIVARSGYSSDSPVIGVGKLVNEMYLFFSDQRGYLGPGDFDTLGNDTYSPNSILRGRIGTPNNQLGTNIRFKVIADLDMDYIFPKNEDTASSNRWVSVHF